MRARKVLRRIARSCERPEALQTVARDIGEGLARGQRDDLLEVARQLAAHAPQPTGDPAAADPGPSSEYWAGFAAAMGTLLAAYEAAHEGQDARAAALRSIASSSAEAVVTELGHGPATGAELASKLGLTPGATSKILKSLRAAGLARILGGTPESIPERGAPKPHVLTSLGSSIARELIAETQSEQPQVEAAMR